MTALTIRESVLEPMLVDIGRALTGEVYEGLRTRLGEKISDHQANLSSPHSGSQLNHAAKTAVAFGWSLEFSWAATESNESAKAYEAALIRGYKEIYGHLPGFKRPDNGGFVPGNRVTPSDRGPVGTLVWSSWRPMENRNIADLPKQSGVYRIRVVPPRA